MARGDDKCICHALQDFLRNERVPYDRRWLQDPSLPLLQSSDTGIVNCVAWFGASFNPVHEAHLEIAATVQRASPAIMAHLCMNFAGVLIGCSSFEDLTRKAGQQNKAHITADVTALPSRDRFELWHRGISGRNYSWVKATGIDAWSTFWTFADWLGGISVLPGNTESLPKEERWLNGKYNIRFARVTKIDNNKAGHNSIFHDEGGPTVFAPLYNKSDPGSNQQSEVTGDGRLGMEITITTDVGGQGSCWWNSMNNSPRPLYKYSHWTPIPIAGGRDAENGKLKSIWVCENAAMGKFNQSHYVFYIHTGAVKEVESLDAWILANANLSFDDKVKQLHQRGFVEPEHLVRRVSELRRS